MVCSRCSGAGSSPLTRGTQWSCDPWRCRRRFIPAHAGNTSSAPPTRRYAAVHPRSRGEHAHIERIAEWEDGSSPLTRGTHAISAIAVGRVRFIPAHAGNTSRWTSGSGLRTVHPRSRGEHREKTPPRSLMVGSSPLTRGTPERRHVVAVIRRFIPAHAGNTKHHQACACRMPVHPRSRGEHVGGLHEGCSTLGSSPLTRGTPGGGRAAREPGRFIPAHAGNTVGGA